MYNPIIRIIIIIAAILTAYLLYTYIIEPFIFRPLCLSNTNSCIQIKYYKLLNSVLFNIPPTGYWVWFNGVEAFVYGQPIGDVCKDDSGKDRFEPAYKIDVVAGLPHSYNCVIKLESLLESYESAGVKPQYIYLSGEKSLENINVQDILNMLQNKKIIDLSSIQ